MSWWSDFRQGLRDKFDPTHESNNPYTQVNQRNFQLPGFGERQRFSDEQMRSAQGREAFTAQDSSFRGDQQAMMDAYRGMYNDDSQSLALRQAERDQAGMQAQQRSLMASASPNNQAMMARVGSQNIGRGNQAIAGNALMGRIAERQGLAGTMSNLSGMARAQDQNMSQFNAQQQQGNRQWNDQAAQGWYGANMQNAALQQSGNMGYEQNRLGRFGIVAGQPTGAERLASGLTGGLMAGVKMMAEGGIVTKPTNAVIGEAGPEAVIPLPYLEQLVERLVDASGKRDQQKRSQEGDAAMQKFGMRKPAPKFDVSVGQAVVESAGPSGVTHERDHIAERPFVAQAKADEAQALADYWARYNQQMHPMNRGR